MTKNTSIRIPRWIVASVLVAWMALGLAPPAHADGGWGEPCINNNGVRTCNADNGDTDNPQPLAPIVNSYGCTCQLQNLYVGTQGQDCGPSHPSGQMCRSGYDCTAPTATLNYTCTAMNTPPPETGGSSGGGTTTPAPTPAPTSPPAGDTTGGTTGGNTGTGETIGPCNPVEVQGGTAWQCPLGYFCNASLQCERLAPTEGGGNCNAPSSPSSGPCVGLSGNQLVECICTQQAMQNGQVDGAIYSSCMSGYGCGGGGGSLPTTSSGAEPPSTTTTGGPWDPGSTTSGPGSTTTSTTGGPTTTTSGPGSTTTTTGGDETTTSDPGSPTATTTGGPTTTTTGGPENPEVPQNPWEEELGGDDENVLDNTNVDNVCPNGNCDPVPEMEAFLVPAFLIAAAGVTRRMRRKALHARGNKRQSGGS